MANNVFPKSEINYLKKNKINTTKKYIIYLKEKYDNDLNRVMDYEWDYYHYLDRKSREERIKMGKPTIRDVRALSRLEQEETANIKEHLRAKGIKFKGDPIITDKKINTNNIIEDYSDVLGHMSNYAYRNLLKKIKNKKKSPGLHIKQLSSKDYLDYLQKKHKFLFPESKNE